MCVYLINSNFAALLYAFSFSLLLSHRTILRLVQQIYARLLSSWIPIVYPLPPFSLNDQSTILLDFWTPSKKRSSLVQDYHTKYVTRAFLSLLRELSKILSRDQRSFPPVEPLSRPNRQVFADDLADSWTGTTVAVATTAPRWKRQRRRQRLSCHGTQSLLSLLLLRLFSYNCVFFFYVFSLVLVAKELF